MDNDEIYIANLNPSYKYVANDSDSYKALANEVLKHEVVATFHPADMTIILSYSSGMEDILKNIGSFIDDNALNFHIDPIKVEGYSPLFSDSILDGVTAKKMANIFSQERDADVFDLQKELNNTKTSLETITEDRDNYQKWYLKSIARENKIKEQIKAIGVLLNAIYPND